MNSAVEGPKDPKPCKVKTPRPASTIVARRRASARYRKKNEDELREKARERMRRELLKADEALWEDARRRAREASRKYRQQNASNLAFRQREARQIAYQKTYGFDALVARQTRIHERRLAAQDKAELKAIEEACRREGAARQARVRDREAAESLSALHASTS
ncbi:hypothetical protein GGX14DRAFT_556181 [Mycena pura]|uniref:Uncharacterized protein n=1 Tax=Mycena pura TaxID=153505 RepID=A0AAD7E2L9_9AGAR|nr:hypothetical protein GGX14DRAFT_556181 [Mycena pura]